MTLHDRLRGVKVINQRVKSFDDFEPWKTFVNLFMAVQVRKSTNESLLAQIHSIHEISERLVLMLRIGIVRLEVAPVQSCNI